MSRINIIPGGVEDNGLECTICEYLQYGTKVRYIYEKKTCMLWKIFFNIYGMYIYIYDWSVYKNCRKRYLQFIYILLKIII